MITMKNLDRIKRMAEKDHSEIFEKVGKVLKRRNRVSWKIKKELGLDSLKKKSDLKKIK